MSKSSRRGVEEWRRIIDGQRSSGLTIAAYCLERGITEGSFYPWKRRLRSAAKSNVSPAPVFVEVKTASVAAVGAIEICLPGERRLLVRSGFDHDLLSELVGVMESLP